MTQKLDTLLQQAFDEAVAGEAAALKELAPLYKKRDALTAQLQPLEAQLRDLQKEIKVAEAPLREARASLARVARAKSSTKSLKTTS